MLWPEGLYITKIYIYFSVKSISQFSFSFEIIRDNFFCSGSCPTQDFLCPGTHLHILFVLTTNPESNFVEIIQHSTHKLWLVFIPKNHCHMVVAQLLDPLHFKMIWFYLMKSVLTLPIYYCYKNCCWNLEINCSWSCLSFFKHRANTTRTMS